MRLSAPPQLAYQTLLISVILYCLHIGLSQPPQVVKADAPDNVFSAARALTVLKDLLQQDQPHPVGSAANQFVRSRIENRLNELGIEFVIQNEWACRHQSNRCAEIENVVATIPGDTPFGATDRESILLMAHYDSVPTSTGAGDDGAAVAAILETARALALEAPLSRPVVLLFTDGEEAGLLGAEAFFGDKNQTRNIGVVLNYEGSGSRGVSRVLRTAPRGSALINLYQQSANPATGNSLSNEVFKRMPNDTDFSTVIRSDLHGIDFAFAEERNHYHTPNDSIANLDLRTLQHHGNNMLPLVRQLLAVDQMPEGEPNVYTDPYGSWVQWPANWQPILVLIAALIFIAALRVNQIRLGQLFVSFTISSFILISAVTGGIIAFKILESRLGPLPGWPAQLWSFRLVLLSAPTLGGLTALWLCQRWSYPQSIIAASALWLLVLSTCLTAFMPDAANLYILALIPATLALLISGFVASDKRLFVNLLSLIAIVPATLGLLQPVEASQGYGWVITLIPAVALFIMLIAPYLLGAVRTLVVVSLITVSASIIWAITAPLYSAHRPQHINFTWYQNQDAGDAYITIRHQGLLPAVLQDGLSLTPFRLLPFSTREFTSWMKLPGVQDGGAGVRILNRTASSVALSVHTRKNIAAIQLYLPASAGLESYNINGQDFSARPSSGEYDAIELTGLFGAQIDIDLQFTAAPPSSAYLANLLYPLPKVMQPFLELRQPLGTSVHQGDQAVSFRTIQLTQ